MSNDLFNLSTKCVKSPDDISKCTEKEQEKLIYSNILEQKILHFEGYMGKIEEESFKATKTKSRKKKYKLLNFSQKKENNMDHSPAGFNLDKTCVAQTNLIKSIKYARRIPKTPKKILDAPGILDDFYMDILDWSATDLISISLLNSVYLWKNNVKQNSVSKLVELDDGCYCAVKFSTDGSLLAGGEDSGDLHIYDMETQKRVYETNVR